MLHLSRGCINLVWQVNTQRAELVYACAGPKHMVNGKLQPSSLDVYIAMEFGSDGDLFNLRCPSHAGTY